MKKTRRHVRRRKAGPRKPEPWSAEAARRWDRMFGGHRLAGRRAPCAHCASKPACDYADSYCPAFARWYAAAYDAAAAEVRRLAAPQKDKEKTEVAGLGA